MPSSEWELVAADPLGDYLNAVQQVIDAVKTQSQRVCGIVVNKK